MFQEVRSWNQENIDKYNEIYIQVPMNILLKRDQKQLDSSAVEGKINNVICIDIKVDEPKCPDLICINDGSKSLDKLAEEIFLFFKKSQKMRSYL